MRIWCQLPAKMDLESKIFKPYINTVKECHNMVKRPDTEIVIKALDRGLNPEFISFPGLRFLNDRDILKNALKSEKEGYDALVITCFFDPSLFALRQLMNIPVIGIAESSMHFASILGKRFAIVTSDPNYIGEIEENIHKYRMEKQVIANNPVRSIRLSSQEFFGCVVGDYKLAIESFEEVAYSCIDDGADVIIAGCGLLSPMLTKMGIFEIDGVPIVDPMITGIKMAEAIVDLNRIKIPIISRKRFYIGTPVNIVNEVVDI
jgi:allantoin racemase